MVGAGELPGETGAAIARGLEVKGNQPTLRDLGGFSFDPNPTAPTTAEPTEKLMTTQLSTFAASPALFMSTREIAELTDKEHKNILADVRTMFDQLGIHSAEFSAQYKDSIGRTLPMFNLPKDLTTTLVSGYSIPMRHAIVKRWFELEATTTATVFDISAGVIAKGQRAWTKIKATAEEQRVLWLEIGYVSQGISVRSPYSALLQSSKTKAAQASERVKNAGCCLSTVTVGLPADVSHPENIRQWAREQDYEAALPADLQDIHPETVTVLNDSEGGRTAKTAKRAESGGEGADIAKRHRAAIAKSYSQDLLQKCLTVARGSPQVHPPVYPPRLPRIQQGRVLGSDHQ